MLTTRNDRICSTEVHNAQSFPSGNPSGCPMKFPLLRKVGVREENTRLLEREATQLRWVTGLTSGV